MAEATLLVAPALLEVVTAALDDAGAGALLDVVSATLDEAGAGGAGACCPPFPLFSKISF